MTDKVEIKVEKDGKSYVATLDRAAWEADPEINSAARRLILDWIKSPKKGDVIAIKPHRGAS